MRGHNICFYGKINKFVPKLSILTLLIWSTGLEYQSLPSSSGKYIVESRYLEVEGTLKNSSRYP